MPPTTPRWGGGGGGGGGAGPAGRGRVARHVAGAPPDPLEDGEQRVQLVVGDVTEPEVQRGQRGGRLLHDGPPAVGDRREDAAPVGGVGTPVDVARGDQPV